MDSKNDNPVSLLKGHQVTPLLEVFYAMNFLKSLFRQGWLRSGISPNKCESVAEHIFGVVSMAMVVADYNHLQLDMIKLFRMAIIHDLGEIFSGDITPYDHITIDEKYDLERASITRLFEPLSLESDYLQIWEEFELGSSPEACFLQQVDKLEMIFQAGIYEGLENIKLDEFYCSVQDNFTDQIIADIFNELINSRMKGE